MSVKSRPHLRRFEQAPVLDDEDGRCLDGAWDALSNEAPDPHDAAEFEVEAGTGIGTGIGTEIGTEFGQLADPDPEPGQPKDTE